MKSPWIVAFAAVLVVHLVLNVADASPWDSITKCLLAPLLVGWTISRGGPRLLAVALVFCFLGDLFLELHPADTMFMLGMASFAAAHVCFIRLFVARGALDGLRARPAVLALYVPLAVVLVVVVWSGLEASQRPPIPLYAALLVGTASTSWAVGRLAGAGGALFLVSDGIVALDQADRWTPSPTGLWIMALYGVAIYLLARGILDHDDARTSAAAPAVREGTAPTTT